MFRLMLYPAGGASPPGDRGVARAPTKFSQIIDIHTHPNKFSLHLIEGNNKNKTIGIYLIFN
jgi:hypothetical protein